MSLKTRGNIQNSHTNIRSRVSGPGASSVHIRCGRRRPNSNSSALPFRVSIARTAYSATDSPEGGLANDGLRPRHCSACSPRATRREDHFKHLPRLPSPAAVSASRMRIRSVVAKAAQDSSDASSGSIVKYVKSSLKQFNTPEDLFALVGIGFGAIAALWASINLIEAIDKLPLFPLLFELIGLSVAWWFIYRNLLFKPDREEFLKNIKISVSRILGQ